MKALITNQRKVEQTTVRIEIEVPEDYWGSIKDLLADYSFPSNIIEKVKEAKCVKVSEGNTIVDGVGTVTFYFEKEL